MECHAVILAGGRGERFWPLSRFHHPKQLIPLLGETTLLEATLCRLTPHIPAERIWLVAGADLAPGVRDVCAGMRSEHFVWEPVARNTAAAIGAAAERILLQEEDAELLVVPSDHWIPNPEAFWESIEAGRKVLSRGFPFVTFGIPPDYPETGYGYIERGEGIDSRLSAWRTLRFHEKPDAARAEEYVRAGSFYWNSGIFLFQASALAEGLRRHLPEMAPVLDRLRRDLRAAVNERAWADYFEGSPMISIDHGLMEKAEAVAVRESGRQSRARRGAGV